MNDNNFYYDSVYETAESREQKRNKQRKIFSRIFLALCIYLLCFNLMSTIVFIIARFTMSPENYAALSNNHTVIVLLSSLFQYGVALPIFLLITKNMQTSEKREKKKLPFSEIIILVTVAELFMYIGSLVSSFLNNMIGNLINKVPENDLTDLVENTPLWLMFTVMVIIAPIVEEIVFRKVIIDRLSIYGDHVAIVFSSVAFGLMHGNLYQLFYAILIGALLGYIYTSTRNVKYTIIIHAIVNFMGSVVVLLISNAGEYMAMFTDNIRLIAFVTELLSSFYVNLQAGIIVAGAVALIYRYKNREIKISTDRETFIPMKDMIKGGIANEGAIFFILISSIFIILNLFS